MVKAELEGFDKAVSERFGKELSLPLAAKSAGGKAFEVASAGMQRSRRTSCDPPGTRSVPSSNWVRMSGQLKR